VQAPAKINFVGLRVLAIPFGFLVDIMVAAVDAASKLPLCSRDTILFDCNAMT